MAVEIVESQPLKNYIYIKVDCGLDRFYQKELHGFYYW